MEVLSLVCKLWSVSNEFPINIRHIGNFTLAMDECASETHDRFQVYFIC